MPGEGDAEVRRLLGLDPPEASPTQAAADGDAEVRSMLGLDPRAVTEAVEGGAAVQELTPLGNAQFRVPENSVSFNEAPLPDSGYDNAYKHAAALWMETEGESGEKDSERAARNFSASFPYERTPESLDRLHSYVSEQEGIRKKVADENPALAGTARVVMGLPEGVFPGFDGTEGLGMGGRAAVAASRERGNFGLDVAEGLSRGVGAVSSIGAAPGPMLAKTAAYGAASDRENPKRGAAKMLATVGLGRGLTRGMAPAGSSVPRVAGAAAVGGAGAETAVQIASGDEVTPGGVGRSLAINLGLSGPDIQAARQARRPATSAPRPRMERVSVDEASSIISAFGDPKTVDDARFEYVDDRGHGGENWAHAASEVYREMFPGRTPRPGSEPFIVDDAPGGLLRGAMDSKDDVVEYTRRVAARAAELDAEDRAPQRVGLGREGGALRLPNPEPAVSGAAKIVTAAKDAARVVLGPTGEITRGKAGGKGDEIAELGIKADLAAKDYRAKVSRETTELKIAAQGDAPLAGPRERLGLGGSGGRKRAASDSAQEPVDHGDYADSRGTEWVERDLAPTTPEEQAIKDARQRFLGATWNAQVDLGFTRGGTDITGWDGDIATGGGAEVPMQRIHDGMGKTVPSVNNELGREIELEGPSHEEWGNWVRGHVAKMKDRHPDVPDEVLAKIEPMLLKESEDARAGKIAGTEGHMASEFARFLERPDFIRNSAGKLVPVHVVNVYRHADSMIGPGAEVVGGQVAFGRGSKSRVDALRQEYVDKGGKGGAYDMAVRSIFGMKPTKPMTALDEFNPKEGSVVKIAARIYDGMANAIRTGIRTGAAAWQAADLPFGNQAVFNGALNNAKGVHQTFRNALSVGVGRGRTPEMQKAINTGGKTENIPDWSRDLHREMTPALGRATKAVAEGTAKWMDEAQESTATLGNDPLVEQLWEKAGARGEGGALTMGEVERQRMAIRFKAFADVPFEKTIAWLKGELSPDQVADVVAQIRERGVARATGSNVATSQRSLVDQNRVTAKAFAFYKWFSNNMGTTARMFKASADTLRAAESAPTSKQAWQMRGAAAAEASRFVIYKALNGAMAQTMAAMLLPFGNDSLDKQLERIRKNPIGYFAGAAFFNAMGGSITNAITSGQFRLRNTLPGRVYSTFFETPFEAAKSLATGKPAEAGAELGRGMEKALPITRGVTRGEFTKPKKGLGRGR